VFAAAPTPTPTPNGASRRTEQAKGAADARLLQAQAEAKAIALQGEAQAAAIRAQADALKSNASLIDLRKAERWDAKLPAAICAGVPIPFLPADKPAETPAAAVAAAVRPGDAATIAMRRQIAPPA